MAERQLRFDERWLARHAGKVMADPMTALVELIANAWDAYATRVDVTLPDDADRAFEVTDTGVGMTRDEFEERWHTIDYNRVAAQGYTVDPPPDLQGARPRKVFGRNGRGRHAAFYFGNTYFVRTFRDGVANTFRVSRGMTDPFAVECIEEESDVPDHGTRIWVEHPKQIARTADDVRNWIGTRFLTDPSFDVRVNGQRVSFDDIPEGAQYRSELEISGVGKVPITVLDTRRTDRHARQHGIAWWVNHRLVGECSWRGEDYEKILDGRTIDARRFSVIVQADVLEDAVLPDWSGFRGNDSTWKAVYEAVQNEIRSLIDGINVERRDARKAQVRQHHREATQKMTPLAREVWNSFVEQVVDKCPTMSDDDLVRLGGILANLELASSKYGLLSKLHEMKPGELDELHEVLDQWTVSMAKLALDEIATRLKLIEELRYKAVETRTDELHELQPIFERGLWMFGAEFESIEFTSNRRMTTVLCDLFGIKGGGSRRRPDFVVRTDSTVGCYSRPSFDEGHSEDGVATLVIVELKKPGITVGSGEKDQVWKYVKELEERGAIGPATKVHGFLLGSEIAKGENRTREEGANVRITPYLYDTVITRAERRMFNLQEKLKNAPFLKDVGLADFLQGEPTGQQKLELD